MKLVQNTLKYFVAGTALVAVATVSIPRPAQADTATTAAIIAGAAAIVGALLLDGNNQPYYISNNRKYYVTQPEASYWQTHHKVVVRKAYVPENEYPVARNAGYRIPQQQQQHHGNNQGHGNQGR
jgi:hypothetical protein